MTPKWTRLPNGKACDGEKMRYHNITKDDMLNGDGLRVVLVTILIPGSDVHGEIDT